MTTARRNVRDRLGWVVDGILPIAILVAAWQLFASIGAINEAMLPSPYGIGLALFDLATGPEIRENLLVTLYRAFGGAALGCACGVAVGIAMARSEAFDAVVSPLVSATYSLPKTAIVPLLILWVGIGHTMAVLAVFLTCLLPTVVQTYHGVTATPNVIVWSARSLGASRREVLWHILLPHALPDILTGIRVALGFSFVVAISAEMIASTAGVGRLIFMYGENGSYAYMFAAITSVVIVAFAADRLLLLLSSRLLSWHVSQRGGHS